MNELTSILVILDRDSEDRSLVDKALVMARSLGARIELFACDAEHEYALRHEYVSRGVEEARQSSVRSLCDYLQVFCDEIAAENLTVSSDAVSDTPLYEGIVRKVMASHPDLVMKSGARETSGGHAMFGLNDWALVRTCPAPLFLSRGRTWGPQPRVAAVVDVSEEESAGLPGVILRTASSLAHGCGGGETDVLFSEAGDCDEHAREAHGAALRSLQDEFRLDARRIQRLSGEPAATLPALVAEQRYDVLVLGALTHRKHLTEMVGTLTRRLMETLDCDFLLVRPISFVSPVQGKESPATQMSRDL